MALQGAFMAAVVTILLLGGPPARADDGKADPAKKAAQPATSASAATKPEAAPPPERVKEVLRESLKLVQSLADNAAKEERQMRFPSPATFAMRFSKEVQADVVRQIGRAQARLGDVPAARATWQSALDTTAAISSLDVAGDRAPLLIGIAEAQLEAGEKDEARFTLRQALQATRSVQAESPFPLPPPPDMEFASDPLVKKSEFLRRIAQLQAKVGEAPNSQESYRQAIAIAESIKVPLNKVHALVEIAQVAPSEIAEPLWAKAVDFAMTQDEFPRAQGVETVLRARIKAGQVDQALATVADRLKGDLRNYALWVLADAIASSDAAIRPAAIERLSQLALKAEFDRASKRLRVFQRLAEAQARLGDYEAAYRTVGEPQPVNNVQTFRATQSRIAVMTAVARAQVKAKQRDAARETAHAALETIAPLPDEDAEAYFPLAELGDLLAQAGDVPGARAVAESVGAAHSRVHILTDVAVAEFRDGKRDEALRTIRLALEAANRAPNDAIWNTASHSGGAAKVSLDPMLSVRQNIAEARAKIGDLDGAITIISELGPTTFAKFTRKNTIETIVNLRLEADDITGARRAVDLINPSDFMFQDDKANLLERVARHQARQLDPAQVLDWARKDAAPRAKLQLLRGLAEGIADRFDPKSWPSKPSDPSGQPKSRPAGP